MVGTHGELELLAELFDQRLAAFAGCDVDDPRFVSPGKEIRKVLVFVPVAHAKGRAEVEVVASKSSDEGPGGLELQAIEDVGSDPWRGRGRQCDGLNIPKRFAEFPKPMVVGSEIVPPFADAVGFVDRQKLHWCGSYGVQKPRVPQPLRSDIHHRKLSRCDLIEPFRLLLVRKGAVDQGRRDTPTLEPVDLIFHQGDQWGDDDRHPRTDQTRELIAKAFSAPGGHDAEAIFAGNDVLNHFLLPTPKSLQAELG